MSGNLMFRKVEDVNRGGFREVGETDETDETVTETQRGDWIIQTFAILLVSVPIVWLSWLANR